MPDQVTVVAHMHCGFRRTPTMLRRPVLVLDWDDDDDDGDEGDGVSAGDDTPRSPCSDGACRTVATV